MTAFLAGFGLSMSLILAIGAQNAFVLRQGLKGEFVGSVVLVCVISEVVLIAVGVAGFGSLVERFPQVVPLIRWAGAIFLAGYGVFAVRRALGPEEKLEAATASAGSLRAAILTCLALTWLNPHVYLDTVVLIGAVAAHYDPRHWLFGGGAMAASAAFFVALGYGARVLQPVFLRPMAWRMLDFSVGALMLMLAGALALG